MRYRILHITTGTFIRKKKNNEWGTKYPCLSFMWKWSAEKWLRKLPDEFMFLDKDDKWEKVLKAELIVIPVNEDMFFGKKYER